MTLSIPMRTGKGLNDRGHWRAVATKVKAQRLAVGWALLQLKKPTEFPLIVVLRRVAPSAGLDDDNLPGSLKATRDAIAAWLGVDDRLRDVVRYVYEQKRGPWAVEIEVMR